MYLIFVPPTGYSFPFLLATLCTSSSSSLSSYRGSFIIVTILFCNPAAISVSTSSGLFDLGRLGEISGQESAGGEERGLEMAGEEREAAGSGTPFLSPPAPTKL